MPAARSTAVQMLREWEKFHLYWLEEPVPRDDVAGYVRVRRIAQQLGVNIAGGEQLETVREMQTFWSTTLWTSFSRRRRSSVGSRR